MYNQFKNRNPTLQTNCQRASKLEHKNLPYYKTEQGTCYSWRGYTYQANWKWQREHK